MENEIEYLNNLSDRLRRINKKFALLNLIEKAKKEYDSYDYESGFETLAQAYELDPKNSTVLRGLGCMRHFSGDYDGAVEYFQKALEYSEAKEVEYTLIGMAYYMQEKLDEAVKYFNLAIEKNDSYTQAYEGRNQAMLENHIKIVDLQEALKKYF